MSGTYALTMGDRGRIVVPADVRERRGLSAGTPMVLLDSPSGLVLLSRDEALAQVRAQLVGTDLVDELLAERRASAATDDAG